MLTKIISWNVNGIRAAERRGFSAWLAGCGADVVALQETKAAPEQLGEALLNPPGYHADWCAAQKAGYSGVASYTRAVPAAVRRGLGDPRFDNEGRVLVSELPQFTLYNVYFPSGSSGMERVAYKLAFYAAFQAYIAPEIAAGRRIVVVGDVNTAYAPIDLARPRENVKTSGFMPEEREALGQIFAGGLVDSFRFLYPDRVKYSWWSQRNDTRSRNIGWRLDYILLSANLVPYLVAADTHPEVAGSDHCPVSAELDL